MITNQKPASQAGDPEFISQSASETVVKPSDYFVWKERVMWIIGTLLFIVTHPLILLLALLVRCTSSGPGFYRQQRVGKNGQEFTFYKIRTMYNGAEQLTGPVWCRPGDSRITPVGKVLRLFYLDEFPQLINVVRGEMSLIGPRPERPEIIDKLMKDIPDYCQRLQVLPGITGLAQINLPPDVDLDSVRAKLALDVEYIETASLGLDFRMILCTVLRVLNVRGGHVPRWLKIERPKPCTEKRLSMPEMDSAEAPRQIGTANRPDAAVADDFALGSKAIVPIAESTFETVAVATNSNSSDRNTKALSKKHPR